MRTNGEEASDQELADDIRRYLDGRPVLAHPDSTAYRVGKFVRRNRWGVMAASVALAAVLASAGAYWKSDAIALRNDRVALRRGAFTPRYADDATGVWALGPESGGRALTTATVPPIELPDIDGNPFDLGAMHGRKVLLVAWASW